MLADLTRSHPVFRVYVSDARATTRDGATNRTAMLGLDGAGAALGIVFERMEVRTIIGRLSPAEEWAIADLPHVGELHVDRGAAGRIRDRLGRRVIAAHELQYYALAQRPGHAPDPRCTLLGREHLQMITKFFASHYPQTIFSPWMLERPFLGIRGAWRTCGLWRCGGGGGRHSERRELSDGTERTRPGLVSRHRRHIGSPPFRQRYVSGHARHDRGQYCRVSSVRSDWFSVFRSPAAA